MLKRVLAVAAALYFVAAGQGLAAHRLERLTLQLKWLPQAQFAGYLVAQAKGFYRQVGLHVAIRPGGPTTDPSAMLANRSADVAIDWMPSALAARERGAPIVNIAQMFQRSGMMLTCRRDSGVRSPADFKGKTLGVWFAGNQYPFLAWMAKLGLTTTGPHPDVHVLRQGAGVEPLLDKQAACISTMTYNEYWQLIDAGIEPAQLVTFRYQDYGVATLEDGLYTTEANLADSRMRDRLARFLRASVKGWQYAMANPHEAVGIVMRVRPRARMDRRHEQRMLEEIVKLIPESGHGIGYLEPAAYQQTVKVLMSGGADPVIHHEPKGAWTHEIWNEAFGG
ncbi:MAG TPA: ABC transporter substrate-binding protein [Stellaceae bacterium]|nr:ABC transporter substrate-binding protein [Stellaceae bacterium]